ncbi:ribose 5-phosphate isomerase A [Fonticula alba]|uniref:ribose-5-phosphate isomerase n=1 Tax=Fonticula alba TaxID=691883 RepID=A0A058Z2U6_FONAL|nr:ribose 5-phosphate isomerase A [Fonticula alba]KCV68441.1 ribose 5-phosphate isomerase A [Fonticula alba]|eukprot:XP_009496873.1 ribose 5-phosphate isomerase A [Fonticula alba]
MSPIVTVEEAKRLAARAAVDQFIESDTIVGIGSGSTIVYVVEYLRELLDAGTLRNLRLVPTSFQSRQLILDAQLNLLDLDHPGLFAKATGPKVIDVTIDGADEIALPCLSLIKGGGGCHTQELMVASISKRLVIVADQSKVTEALNTVYLKGIPVEVVPAARLLVERHIHAALEAKLPELQVALRQCGHGKAGPVVTDNGCFILDLLPGQQIPGALLPEIQSTLTAIPGVTSCGLFLGMASAALVCSSDGIVTCHTRPTED